MKCLIVQEGDAFTAVLLDHLVEAHGTSAEQSLERLHFALTVHAEFEKSDGIALTDLPPASERWLKMWDAAVPMDGFEASEDVADARVFAAAA